MLSIGGLSSDKASEIQSSHHGTVIVLRETLSSIMQEFTTNGCRTSRGDIRSLPTAKNHRLISRHLLSSDRICPRSLSLREQFSFGISEPASIGQLCWALVLGLLLFATGECSAQNKDLQNSDLSDPASAIPTQETAPVPAILQDTNQPTGNGLSSKTSQARELEQIPAEVIYLPNAAGTLVPVPAGGTVEGYVEWLKAQRSKSKATKAPWSVSSVEVNGVVESEHARLKIQIIMDSLASDAPFSIALGLNEATLTKITQKPQVDSERDATESVDQAKVNETGKLLFGGFDREEGYRWWVARSGRHELELEAIVPLRKQSATTRLLLTLPPSAVSHAALTIPQVDLTIKMAESFTQLPANTSTPGTIIDAFGFGPKMDVSWQPAVVQAADASLESSTILTARVNSDSCVIDAVQRLRVPTGNPVQFAMRIPQGFELVTIESRDYREHTLDPNIPNRVLISLSASTTGLVTLNWTVRKSIALGEAMTIQGFQVEKARRQNGEIGLIASDGIQLKTDDLRTPQMVRMAVADWQAQNSGAQVFRAYRFFGSGFQLGITPQPVTPYVVCEPQIFLTASENEWKLEAVYPVEVYRGRITSMEFHWPGWQRQNWVMEAIEPRGPVVESFIIGGERRTLGGLDSSPRNRANSEVDSGGSNSNLTIVLSSPRSERFTIRLRARRMFDAGSASQFITVPMPLDSAQVPATLVIANSENIESTIQTSSGVPLRSPAATTTQDLLWPAGLNSLRHTVYRLPAELNDLRATIQPQPRRISGTSQTSIVLQDRQLRIDQSLQLKVQYEPLEALLLKVPEEIVDRCEFRYEKGELLPSVWGPLLPSGHRQVQLNFRTPVLGNSTVKATYSFPLSDQATKIEPVKVRLITPIDFSISSSTVEYPKGQALAPTSPIAGWRSNSSPSSPHQWISNEGVDSITLRLEPGSELDGDRPDVDECVNTVICDESGKDLWTTSILLSSSVPNLIIELPGNAQSPRFFWNGQEVPPVSTTITTPEVKTYTLLRPNTTRSETQSSQRVFPNPNTGSQLIVASNNPLLLQVTWLSQTPVSSRWSSEIRLQGAQLPFVNWSGQSYWDVRLSGNQYLLNYSRKLSPLFRWQRQGLFWRRNSPATPISEGFQEYAQQLQTTLTPSVQRAENPDSLPVDLNRYLFTEFGRPETHQIAAISMPLIVFIGAGFALATGFLLLRIPRLRQPIPLLMFVFAISLVGLFQMPVLQLLAQPIIIGLIFPILAILLERWSAYRHGQSILTLSHDSTGSYRAASAEPSMTALFSNDGSTQYRRPQLTPASEGERGLS
ncbi:hypothetical protein Spb1_26660 [Planctopirus ephydatiae]|uniref:Uncharacterized protein n=1 Tax=Planctopirus ephydatiae TaxID=2528019 RepID=A0A518GQ44_9PLAN|nr:hypothetical protein Spb1_26660 [Planctopirus ephydatiae]